MAKCKGCGPDFAEFAYRGTLTRLRFEKTVDFTPPENRRFTVRYKAGHEYDIRSDWATKLIDGVNVTVVTPKAIADILDVETVAKPSRRRAVKTEAEEGGE